MTSLVNMKKKKTISYKLFKRENGIISQLFYGVSITVIIAYCDNKFWHGHTKKENYTSIQYDSRHRNLTKLTAIRNLQHVKSIILHKQMIVVYPRNAI